MTKMPLSNSTCTRTGLRYVYTCPGHSMLPSIGQSDRVKQKRMTKWQMAQVTHMTTKTQMSFQCNDTSFTLRCCQLSTWLTSSREDPSGPPTSGCQLSTWLTSSCEDPNCPPTSGCQLSTWLTVSREDPQCPPKVLHENTPKPTKSPKWAAWQRLEQTAVTWCEIVWHADKVQTENV